MTEHVIPDPRLKVIIHFRTELGENSTYEIEALRRPTMEEARDAVGGALDHKLPFTITSIEVAEIG